MAKNITAVFSNGFEDTYKGNRDVKAAWMITDKESGEVLASGHSLDRAKAEKTAKGNVQYVGRTDKPRFIIPNSAMYLHDAWLKDLIKNLRKYGFEIPSTNTRSVFKIARDANSARAAEQRSNVNIEVIDL